MGFSVHACIVLDLDNWIYLHPYLENSEGGRPVGKARRREIRNENGWELLTRQERQVVKNLLVMNSSVHYIVSVTEPV